MSESSAIVPVQPQPQQLKVAIAVATAEESRMNQTVEKVTMDSAAAVTSGDVLSMTSSISAASATSNGISTSGGVVSVGLSDKSMSTPTVTDMPNNTSCPSQCILHKHLSPSAEVATAVPAPVDHQVSPAILAADGDHQTSSNISNNNLNTPVPSSQSARVETAQTATTVQSQQPVTHVATTQQQTQGRIQPMIEYYYENQATAPSTYAPNPAPQPAPNTPNCFMFSALSYPFVPGMGTPNMNNAPPTGSQMLQKQQQTQAQLPDSSNNCLYYHHHQMLNNFQQGYRWMMSPRESTSNAFLTSGAPCGEAIPTTTSGAASVNEYCHAPSYKEIVPPPVAGNAAATAPSTTTKSKVAAAAAAVAAAAAAAAAAAINVAPPSNVVWCKGDSSPISGITTKHHQQRRQSAKCGGGGSGSSGGSSRQKFSNKMHPVQLLHQIFRKEAFVMEYERVNDGPFSQVRVTYKVNGKSFTAEATRLKEARRLCAKQVLRDQFPDLDIELDNDIPEAEYDARQFDNKHPVQILYQIFRYEPMEMHCEEEGAAHFAKHIFTFSIRGNKYQAKAETIKEAKRRAAIMALNDYFNDKNKAVTTL